MSSNQLWADISDASGSEKSDDFVENEGQEILDENSFKELKNEGITVSKECSCLTFSSDIESVSYLKSILDFIDFSNQDYRCHINNILRVYDKVSSNNKELDSPLRLAFVDIFYRVRHEILFKLVCLSLNISTEKSDMSFREFGIDSDRTPDLIYETEDKKLIIMEISAGSSIERAAANKGLEEAGFESKYKKELDMLTSKGIKFVYAPILFDMSHTNNLEFIEMLGKIKIYFKQNLSYTVMLKVVREDLCLITNQIKSYLIAPSAVLFTKSSVIVKPNHDQMDYSYKISRSSRVKKSVYRELCISGPVYNKFMNNWHRLSDILDRVNEDKKIYLYYDTSNGRIMVEQNIKGYKKSEYTNSLACDNKVDFLQLCYMKVGREYKPIVDSNDGIKFIVKGSSKGNEAEENTETVMLVDHNPEPNTYILNIIDLKDYKKMLDNHFRYNYEGVFYNDGFEDGFVKMICGNDNLTENKEKDVYFVESKVDFMAKKELGNINIKEKMDELILEQVGLNSYSDKQPLKVFKNKNPFLLPIAKISSQNYCNLNFKNSPFISDFKSIIEESDPFTFLIVDKICDLEFEFIKEANVPSENLRRMMSERAEKCRQITLLTKEYYKSFDGKMGKIRDCKSPKYSQPYSNLNNRIRDLNKAINLRKKEENVLNETQLIRLPTKSKGSYLNQKFNQEMEHYKDKKSKSVVTGVGYRSSILSDFESDKAVFTEITEWLSEYSGENPALLIDSKVSDDCKLLRELKEKAISEYDNLIKSVRDSYLGHAASFVSNLAHSLLYYSQMPFNSDYIRVDNLGLNNVLLIVKGGKKIFKSKASKMFRILYPISEVITPWIESGSGLPSSTKIIHIQGNPYILSPWSQMHESILNDSVSFYTRVVSFTILNLNHEIPFIAQFPKVSFNVLLAFHNRRQTEVMLANLRYILLATLGDFTGIIDIFKEFLGFNYDCFQSYIRGCIMMSYPEYYEKIKTVKDKVNKFPNFNDYTRSMPKHLFTSSNIEKEEDLALMIYSTFLMTKAPYQRPAERARNLRGILEIHEYFCSTKNWHDGKSIKDFHKSTTYDIRDYKDLGEYSDQIFSNDFNYDPSYCAQLGVFADSYYNNKNLKEDLFVQWNSILNQTWDELATSTGLRGKYNDLQNFWGQKGYFVVYRELAKDPDFIKNLTTIFNLEMDNDKKRKLMRDLNIIYNVKVDIENDFLIFHAADKVQWRGGREIYIMDIDTKTVQQPIEKFMGYLCSKLDNELISIPSDKRSQVIHHSIFERDLPLKDTLTWYLTLDCSKWAPKSNYLKFIDMFLPMDVLPPTFKTHFLNYCQKLFHKKVYFNIAEVEVLKNSDNYRSAVEKYLIEDKDRNAYYLEMPYSWVMGIFNYTSSFMHAINQKYSSYIIFKTGIISYNEESTLYMFAHSDDSGGRLTCSSKFMARRSITLYELQLKMCNHILSKKKSVVSRFYFEILSVLYIFKKLLALLPKFLGGLRFLPSDKGPCHDQLQSYSKCIEVMVSGASFNVAYLVMKMYSMMVYRFYNSQLPNINRYDLPVQYLGLPDAHPLMVLLCGADSDIVRLISTGKRDLLIKSHSFFETVTKTIEEEGPIKPIKFNIQVRGLRKGFEEVIDKFRTQIDTWSISNVNYHNSGFNFLSFLSKLNDSGFVGSLVNESSTRRLSRAYYMRKGDCITTTLGLISLETFGNVIDSLLLVIDGRKIKYKGIFSDDILRDLEVEILSKYEHSNRQIELLESMLTSPLRIVRYMEELSLENKQIIPTTRTLKPTHVELIKSPKTFSVNFDPAQMVSYIKEPEMSWALPNVRNMFEGRKEVESLCLDQGFKIEEIDPSNLLKMCRNYGFKYKKEIYMYSQVPSEIRQIKTYSSFLTFLATNTYSNKEIKGLVLKLKSNLTDPGYLPVNIDEDIYVINNCLSIINVFSRVCDMEFLLTLNIKPINFLKWKGGTIEEFLERLSLMCTENEDSVHYKLCLEYLKDIFLRKFSSKTNASFLKESSYYYFPRSQKSKGGWTGRGEITICIKDSFYSFDVYNDKILSLRTNVKGKVPKKDMSYIMDVLNKSGLSLNNTKTALRSFDKGMGFVFGIDVNGDYSISRRIEVQTGVPAQYQDSNDNLRSKCDLYDIKSSGKNSFILEPYPDLGLNRIKIYTLPLLQGEILSIIKSMFYPADFEKRMLSEGLNDFEEFILTEIMTEYGFEIYVNPDEFFDNFISSKLYNIFMTVKKEGISKLPKTLVKKTTPACEGSLLRILIDFTRVSGEEIVKMPGNLTKEIMELRARYPDNVSALLRENLVKCHEKIYNEGEIEEIRSAYENLYLINDVTEMEKSVVKLLTYWGYGSLVNSLENYKLSKNDNNFWYFSIKYQERINISITSGVFINLHKVISKCMANMFSIYDSLNFSFRKYYMRSGGVFRVIDNMNHNLTFTLYGFKTMMVNNSFYRNCFINAFLAYLEDDDFVNMLKKEASKDYILSGIDFSFKNRRKIIALYNSLCYSYYKQNLSRYKLDYIKKVDRIPNDQINPISHYKKLVVEELTDNVPKFNLQYHSFLNDDILSYLKSSFYIESNGVGFRVSQDVRNPTDDYIPPTGLISLKHVYNPEVFDDENWEEIIDTINCGDAEWDDIEEYYEAIPNKFMKPKTKKLNLKMPTIQTTITWIIDPYITNRPNSEGYYRQCGENIAVITNNYLKFFRNFPNSHLRLVNMNKILKSNKCRDFLVYISCNKYLTEDFWDKLIGGQKIEHINLDIVDRLFLDDYLIGKEKIGHFLEAGKSTQELFDMTLETKKEEEGEEESANIDKESEVKNGHEEQLNDEVSYETKIISLIDNAVKEGVITKKVKWRLVDKYLDSKMVKVYGFEDLFKNCVNEITLRGFNKKLEEGTLTLSKEGYFKTYHSPTHFSLDTQIGIDTGTGFKSKEVNAELNSLNEHLAKLISTDNISMSENMYKILCSHHKVWLKVFKNTNYKRENKKFFILLFTTISNGANVFKSSEQDSLWQDTINLITNYISEDGPENIEDDDMLDLDENFISASKMKYRTIGFR